MLEALDSSDLAIAALGIAILALLLRWSWAKRRPQSVYIMVREPDHKIKIGKARDPEERLSAGRTWIPEGLDLRDRWDYDDGRTAHAVERTAHDLLKKYRITGKGNTGGTEWFDVSFTAARSAVLEAEASVGAAGKEIWWLRVRWRARDIRYRTIEPVKVTMLIGGLAALRWPAEAGQLAALLPGL